MKWLNIENVEVAKFTCAYCRSLVASDRGYTANGDVTNTYAYIRICPNCQYPTFFTLRGYQHPTAAFGKPVSHLPSQEVEALYDEARNCMRVAAYIAAVMCCKKILMNMAVTEGAKEGKSFVQYLDYLKDQGFIPAKGKEWVEYVRLKGNEASYEISVMERKDAEQFITFLETLLRANCEFPATLQK
jgi:hypothetical protein